VKIRVVPDKCQGPARCSAPELFSVDDYGLSTVIGDGTVPVELEEKAQLAIANCPEYAIEEPPD
jgi:ferredoxin